MDGDTRSVLVKIATSRKGIGASVTTLGCIAATIVLSWAAGTGRVSWDVYFARLEKIGAIVGGVWSFAGIGWSLEDAAEKRAPAAPAPAVAIATTSKTAE